MDPANNTQTQIISNNPIISNNDIDNTPTTNIAQPNDQSTIFLQAIQHNSKRIEKLHK